jgi:hypothetical protein
VVDIKKPLKGVFPRKKIAVFDNSLLFKERERERERERFR